MASPNQKYIQSNMDPSQYGLDSNRWSHYHLQQPLSAHPPDTEYYSYPQFQMAQPCNPVSHGMLSMDSPQGLLYNAMSIPTCQDNGLQASKRRTGTIENSPKSSPRSKRRKFANEKRKQSSPILKYRKETFSPRGSQLLLGCDADDMISETGTCISECCSSCSEGSLCDEPDCEIQKDAVVPCTKQSCDVPVCPEPCLPRCIQEKPPSWETKTMPPGKKIFARNSIPWGPQEGRASPPLLLNDEVRPANFNSPESTPANSGYLDPDTPSVTHQMEASMFGRVPSKHHLFGGSCKPTDSTASAPAISGTGAMFDTAGWVGSTFDDANLGSGSFNCAWAECQRPFSTQEEWSYHLHQAHVDPQMTFDCPLQLGTCPSNLSSHPLDHLQVAHGFDFSYNNYSCPAPACPEDETFCNPAMLHNHFDQAHANPASGLLFCQWNACNSTFTGQRDLLYHLTDEHHLVYPTQTPSVGHGPNHPETIQNSNAIPNEELSEVESGCSCQWNTASGICGVVCENPKELQDHITGKHLKSLNKSTGYYCRWNKCNRAKFGDKAGFSQRGKLIRHMQTHTILKEEVCDFPGCGRQFSAKQALLQHKRLHTGEKPFQCKHCDRAFAQQSACTMHERTHTGLKPLQCEHCGKRFSESSNLSKHRRMHQEEKEKKSYRCDFAGCGKAFVRFASLKNHKEAHSRTDRGDSTAFETDSDELAGGRKHVSPENASNDS